MSFELCLFELSISNFVFPNFVLHRNNLLEFKEEFLNFFQVKEIPNPQRSRLLFSQYLDPSTTPSR